MKINPFKLERYMADYEFTAPYLLCCSDCESLSLAEVLSMADEEHMKLWKNLNLGYTESQGNPLLRQEISKLYNNISPEQIIVTAPQEAILLFMISTLQKDNHIISTFPSYQSLYEIGKSTGCRVSYWKPEYNNGWHFDISNLEKLITKKTKLIIINFPHNPTGALLTKSELDRIVEIADKNGIYIFSDEMYRSLEYKYSNQLPSVADIYNKGISLSGMSKSLSLPGLRIGWLTTQNNNIIKKIKKYRDYTTICSSAPSEILSLIALRNHENIINNNLKIIKDNLKILEKFFENHSDIFTWTAPQAGPVAFVELTIKTSITEFCKDLVAKKGVMLLPSEVFDYKGDFFRIGFGRKNLKISLQKLEEYIKTAI